MPANRSTPPTVITSIQFAKGICRGSLDASDRHAAWIAKLDIGSQDAEAYEFLTVQTNGRSKRIRVETCAEYTNALAHGAYAQTTFDLTMESWFRRASGTLQFMGHAESFTRRLPDDFLARLPISLLSWHGSDEEAQLTTDMQRGQTLEDYARSGKVRNLQRKSHKVTFQTKGQNFTIEELARGDWNGDGQQDALIAVTWRYLEGSGRGQELYVFSKGELQPFDLRTQR